MPASGGLGFAPTVDLGESRNRRGLADVPSALLMQMSCQFRTGQSESADQTLERLLTQHADSSACLQAIVSHCGNHPLEPCDGPLADHLITHAKKLIASPQFTSTLKPAAIGLLVSAHKNDANAESIYASAIATRDQTGDMTAAIPFSRSKTTTWTTTTTCFLPLNRTTGNRRSTLFFKQFGCS